MVSKKTFAVFAYPTVSANFLHVGHGRSYIPADCFVKYREAKGEEVFFPIGFHATGIDTLNIFDRLKDPSTFEDALKRFGISKDQASNIQNVDDLIELFSDTYLECFRALNIQIDEKTRIATSAPLYARFVSWQFQKLQENGRLIVKDYTLPYCFKDDNPVNLDSAAADIREGSGGKVVNSSLVKLKDNRNRIYPIITESPERLLAADKLLVHPGSHYLLTEINNNEWIMGKSYADYIKSSRDLTTISSLKGTELIGRKIINPLTSSDMTIVDSESINPKYKTGIFIPDFE